MASALVVTVAGIPRPQGSKNRGKNGALYESSKGLPNWREAVRHETVQARDRIIKGPVRVLIKAYFPRPKSHYRTGRNAHLLRDDAPVWHAGKPDSDKVARAILDALKEAGAIEDDCRVARLEVAKLWCPPGEQRAVITIAPLEAE